MVKKTFRNIRIKTLNKQIGGIKTECVINQNLKFIILVKRLCLIAEPLTLLYLTTSSTKSMLKPLIVLNNSMKNIRYFTLILFIMSTLISCTKDKADTNGYYVDYNPDIVLSAGDSLSLDVDNNSTADVLVYVVDPSNIYLTTLNTEYTVSIGNFIGSGSSNLDSIAYNEIIDNSLYWSMGYSLFTSQINYIGLKKEVNNTTTFGWVKVNISNGNISIDDHYFRTEEGTDVRAGIKN